MVDGVAGPEKRKYNMVMHEVPERGWTITREWEGYTFKRISRSVNHAGGVLSGSS